MEKLPSWQINGDGSGVLGNSTQSSQKSCPNNWQNMPYVKVSVMVPEGSCEELDKRNAESHNVTIVEAKKLHGFQNPNDWLYFLPKGLTTDIVIGVGERLCKMAQIFKELEIRRSSQLRTLLKLVVVSRT